MFKIARETELLLEDIERRIDPETEEDYRRQWEDFLYDRFEISPMHWTISILCFVPRCRPYPGRSPAPPPIS